ncbi:MAG: terminase family protein [Candidatus Methanoperedens sp.]
MRSLASELLKDFEAIDNINYRPHTGQSAFHESKARFRILAAGRRFGKTQAACYEAVQKAIIQPGAVIWICAPIFGQAMISWRMIRQFMPLPLLKNFHLTEKFVELKNGSTIWIKSGDNPDNLRGEGLDFLVIDEAAMIKEEIWQEALRPALADKQGRAVIISTPKAHNWFFELWTRGQDPQYSDYQSWKLPTSANPYILAEEIEEAKRTLPELVFRQEFMAEFLDDIGAVFRGIHKCIGGKLHDLIEGESYVMGVDLAKYSDFSVISVMNQKGDLVAFDRFNKIDWAFQMERIKNLAQKYKAKVFVDSTGVGDPIFENLQRSGLDIVGYKFTNESKKQLIEGLSLAMELGKVHFPDIPEILHELTIFGYSVTASGTVVYSAPGSYHDDCVISLALANYGITARESSNLNGCVFLGGLNSGIIYCNDERIY